MRKMSFTFVALALSTIGLGASGFGSTAVRSSVFPAATVPGGTVVYHMGVLNESASSEAVSISITVKNPGGCVSNAVPSHVATLLLGLRGHATELATLSQTIPADACAGTYTVTVLVKNALGQVVATHTTTFTINPAPKL